MIAVMSFPPASGPPQRIRLLVLDVDGTVTTSRHEVADATCDAIGRLLAAGVRVMLATGRRYRDTLPVAGRLGLDLPLVTASGALVKHPVGHETLHRATFAAGALERVIATTIAAGYEPVLYTDSYAEGFDFHCRRLDVQAVEPGRGLREYLDRNVGLAAVRPDLDRSPPAGVFAGFAMGDHREMVALEAALEEACPGQLSVHTLRSPRYRDWLCEIAPVGVDKWSGVMAVARNLGVDAAEICAVGDDVNDLPMIRGAGLGVAMGNGRPEVIAAADRVVATNDAGGIVEVAETLLTGLA
jgi:hypothetical protein